MASLHLSIEVILFVEHHGGGAEKSESKSHYLVMKNHCIENIHKYLDLHDEIIIILKVKVR